MIGLAQAVEVETNEEANRQNNNSIKNVEIVKSNGKTYTFLFEYGDTPIDEFFKKIIYK